MEDQILQAALDFYHTDIYTQEIDILRDKAIFWENRARELEIQLANFQHDNSSKDDTITSLNSLLATITAECNNLRTFKDRLLTLSITTDLEEQLLKAKLQIARLREQQEDNEFLISQLRDKVKVTATQNKDAMIQKLRNELINAEQSTGEIRPHTQRESISSKLFNLRGLLGRKKPGDCSVPESIHSSFYQ